MSGSRNAPRHVVELDFGPASTCRGKTRALNLSNQNLSMALSHSLFVIWSRVEWRKLTEGDVLNMNQFLSISCTWVCSRHRPTAVYTLVYTLAFANYRIDGSRGLKSTECSNVVMKEFLKVYTLQQAEIWILLVSYRQSVCCILWLYPRQYSRYSLCCCALLWRPFNNARPEMPYVSAEI